jgi:hypothetical protein
VSGSGMVSVPMAVHCVCVCVYTCVRADGYVPHQSNSLTHKYTITNWVKFWGHSPTGDWQGQSGDSSLERDTLRHM